MSYLSIRDCEQVIDINKDWRNSIGECQELINKIIKYQAKDIQPKIWYILNELNMPHTSRAKKLIAKIKMDQQVRSKNMKKLFRKYNKQEWPKTNAFDFFIMNKYHINYQKWKTLRRENATKEEFMKLYGDIYRMIHPEVKQIIKYEAKLFMTNTYQPRRLKWEELMTTIQHQ